MIRFSTFVLAGLIACGGILFGSPDRAAWAPVENQVAQATAGPQVTLVHFWAPWCSNCQAELKNTGWRDFLYVNPEVKVIFVTLWSKEDGAGVLKKVKLGGQPNFQLLLHPNGSRKADERVQSFMGEPINWIPTTWIFKDGQLRYALNYGEIRFPLLQQLVRDAADKWDHEAK